MSDRQLSQDGQAAGRCIWAEMGAAEEEARATQGRDGSTTGSRKHKKRGTAEARDEARGKRRAVRAASTSQLATERAPREARGARRQMCRQEGAAIRVPS